MIRLELAPGSRVIIMHFLHAIHDAEV